MTSIENHGTNYGAADTAIREIVNGQTVHFAQRTGKYELADGGTAPYPVQNDRMAVIEMPQANENCFALLLREAMDVARRVTLQAAAALLAKGGSDALGTCTATLVAYDPRSFTLDVASIDDSPAFVVLDDGKKVEAVMVTTPVGHKLEGVGEFICRVGVPSLIQYTQDADGTPVKTIASYPDEIRKLATGTPHAGAIEHLLDRNLVEYGSYRVNGHPRHFGQIELEALKNEVADRYGMNKDTISMHLVVASDGICSTKGEGNNIDRANENYPFFDLDKKEFIPKPGLDNTARPPNRVAEGIVRELYKAAKSHSTGNLADDMAQWAENSKAYDNLSITVVEDLRQGKGKPLVACVADTAGMKPKPAAQMVISTLQLTLPQLDAQYGEQFFAGAEGLRTTSRNEPARRS